MSTSAEVLAMDIFFADCQAATNKEQLVAAYIKAVASLGYDRVNISTMRDLDLPDSEQKFALRSNYPPAWLLRYDTCNYIAIDPVAQRARGGFDPFFWSQLRDLTRAQRAFFKEAEQAGLYNGVGLPFLGASTQLGGIALATSTAAAARSTNLQLLWAMANLFYQKYKKLASAGRAPTLRQSLARQQLAVLRLLQRGSSDKEIADALHISEHTVNQHIREILKRLGARNRTEAVSHAIYYGII